MKIEFLNVKIKGFLSIGEAEVDLRNRGFTLISGVNNNSLDNASSNGSGKSALLGSIIWALAGETIRGTKDVVNKFTNTGTCVELDFNIDNINYKIIRYKDFGNVGTDLKLYVNGVDKSGKGIRDTSKILGDYLPDITAELLGSVVILGQGLPQRFTNNTPSGRKEILEKLSKSDFMITDIKDKLGKRKVDLSNQIRVIEDNLLSLNTKKNITENQFRQLRENKALLVPLNYFDNDIKVTEEAIEKFKIIRDDLDSSKQIYTNKVNDKLDEYQKWVSNVNSNILSESAHVEENEGLVELNKIIQQNENLIYSKEQEITKLENIRDMCPTCGQKLPDVHKVDTSELKNDLELIKKNNEKALIRKSEIQIRVDNKINALKNKLNSTTESIKEEGRVLREEYNKIILDLDSTNSEINSLIVKLDKLKLNKENNEKYYNTIDEDISKCEKQLSDFSEQILYNNLDKDNKNKHLDIVNKMITIATRDFRGYLLSGIIDYINLKSKEYCKDIFNTENIEFKLDGNSIFIGYCGKAYENLSGGEKQKIDLIVQFAIRDMLSQFLDFRSNIICLDEIFDNLDNIGCQNVLNLISNKLNDIESIFIITHHSDIDIPTDDEIVVVKNSSGISEIM